jgi:hypothetical protein
MPPMTENDAMEGLVRVNVVDGTDGTHEDGYIWDNSVPKKLKYAIPFGSEDAHTDSIVYDSISDDCDTMYLVDGILVDEFRVTLGIDLVHHLVKTKEYILHALMKDTNTEYAILKDAEHYYRASVTNVVKYSPVHHDRVDTTESDGGDTTDPSDTDENDFRAALKF